MPKIKLYHFTSEYHLPHILKDGLSRGDVPLNPMEWGVNAVWLTDNPDPGNQDWKTGSPVDKTAVMIEVELNVPNISLVKWSVYARKKKIDPQWYKKLDETGGGQSEHWWLYFGVIPPERFKVLKSGRGDNP